MATKTATVAQPEVTDAREEGPDAPLLDTLGAELKKLVQKGKERGYVTYDELNAALPPDEVSSEQIEDTMAMLSEAGVNVVEAEEQEDTSANPAEPVFPQAEALLSKAPTVLGLDGTKMSKTKGNVIEIGMDADTTARLIKKAVTDSDRHITYDPVKRPEVSNLLMLAALCTDRDPVAIADEIGDGGGGGLKKRVTAAVNEYFAPIRAKRAELVADQGYLLSVLREGNARANAIADATLDEVRQAMGMVY